VTVTAESRTDLDRIRSYIDGEWVEPQGSESHRAIEAATGEVLGTASLDTDADIDAPVQAARRALGVRDHGGRTTAAERAAVIRRFAEALRARAEGTSTLVSRENGMPITLSSAFSGAAPRCCWTSTPI
jgi:aldehyde dehydrogenase (NAD+)